MVNRSFGWVKDTRDERDYLLTALKPAEIPDKVDLSSILPPVRDQKNQSACVGYGIGGILTGKAIQVEAFEEWFSPRWIYYIGRLLGGYVNQDWGTEPRLALDGLLKYGCLLESIWKYEPKFTYFEKPPENVYVEALKRPLLTYTRVVDGIEGIRSALAGNNLVAIGSPWFSKWSRTDDNGKLTKIRCWDSVAGGHETFLYGYEDDYFFGFNSWGLDWGNDGHYLMPFGAIRQFKKRGGYDSHIISVNWSKQ